MPRAGQTTTALGAGLPQRVVLGLLMRSFPPRHVDQIVDVLGRREQRQRLLPARLVVYLTLGLWIFGELSYEEVLAEIVRGIPGLTHPAGTENASAAAIGRARLRLGVEPLRLLFENAVATAGAAGNSMTDDFAAENFISGNADAQNLAAQADSPLAGGLRPLRLGRITVEAPDTLANRVEFAARDQDGIAHATPRVYLSVLTDGAAHRIVAASICGGADLARDRSIAASIPAGSLVLMDGERPFSTGLWTVAGERGYELLWPVADTVAFPVHHRLPDGSGLSRLPGAKRPARIVRVIDRAVPNDRLVTSILDHRKAPADRLTAAYDQHRVKGNGFRGLTAHRGGDRIVLRSKSPDLVRQELYAMLCVQHAIGELVDFTMLDGGPRRPIRSPECETPKKRSHSGASRVC
ncbi:MAG: transposase domain-containing protein [Actinocrinis sp.]